MTPTHACIFLLRERKCWCVSTIDKLELSKIGLHSCEELRFCHPCVWRVLRGLCSLPYPFCNGSVKGAGDEWAGGGLEGIVELAILLFKLLLWKGKQGQFRKEGRGALLGACRVKRGQVGLRDCVRNGRE